VGASLEYLLRGAQWDEAVAVVLAHGPEVFEQGKMHTVIRWIERIPDSIRGNNMNLMLLQGLLEASSGNLAKGEGILARAVANPDITPGEFAAAQGILSAFAQWRPHPQQSRAIAFRALEALEAARGQVIPDILGLTDPRSLETVATISAGRSYFLDGDLAAARVWLTRALISEGAQYPIWRAHTLGSLALVEIWSGRSRLASELAAEALTAARDVNLLDHPATGDAYLAMAMSAIERGDPGNASIALHEGTIRANTNGRTQLAWVAHLERALLRAARGETATLEPPVGPAPPVVEERIVAMNSRVLRLTGSLELALKTARQSSLRSSAVLFEQAACALTLENSRLAESSIAAMAALPDAEEPLPLLKRTLLLSWLAHSRHDRATASRLLTDALELGELNDLVEVFVRAGPTVIAQISALPASGSRFLQRVIGRGMDFRAASLQPVSSFDLTGREREILQYLPTRMTTAEIAQRCYVSINTVKTHVTHIYRKLDVADRSAAIERATQLGLV
jgi:LuxR family transcriptional regulator, maltose regulon positive regulatory protein